MRLSSTIAFALVLAASAHAAVLPSPVRPAVLESSAFSTFTATVRLTQDSCYEWQAPQVARTGDTFAITQSVARLPECGTPATRYAWLELGRLPAGAYRLTYTATGSAAAMFPPHAGEFAIQDRTGAGDPETTIEPAHPTALEPITAFVNLNVCEWVTGYRIRGDALEIVTQADFGGWCDYDPEREVDIGSFPPGDYTLRVVRATPTGDVVLATRAFTVGPPRAAGRSESARDLSGLWISPDEEPGTAIAFINAADRQPEGQYNGLTGVWYRYDATGQPVWYLLETRGDGRHATRFTGSAQRYASANPEALPFQRRIAGASRGTVTIEVDYGNREVRMRGVVEGEPVDIQFRPFRWTRNAWSGND
ncbi:MAG TPA: hypothetical protein VFL14_01260 [Xanthomonadales bacterium]|nr:hypothetical protein [Xanthomonadales bacterium]